MTNTTDTTATLPSASSPRVEKAVSNLLTIGRLWATHGVEIGLSALAASAESLRIASETLADVKDRLKNDPASAPAS